MTTVDVLELVWERLLHVTSVLIVRILTELHRLLVTSVTLLHANFGGHHVLWRVLHVRA